MGSEFPMRGSDKCKAATSGPWSGPGTRVQRSTACWVSAAAFSNGLQTATQPRHSSVTSTPRRGAASSRPLPAPSRAHIIVSRPSNQPHPQGTADSREREHCAALALSRARRSGGPTPPAQSTMGRPRIGTRLAVACLALLAASSCVRASTVTAPASAPLRLGRSLRGFIGIGSVASTPVLVPQTTTELEQVRSRANAAGPRRSHAAPSARTAAAAAPNPAAPLAARPGPAGTASASPAAEAGPPVPRVRAALRAAPVQ